MAFDQRMVIRQKIERLAIWVLAGPNRRPYRSNIIAKVRRARGRDTRKNRFHNPELPMKDLADNLL